VGSVLSDSSGSAGAPSSCSGDYRCIVVSAPSGSDSFYIRTVAGCNYTATNDLTGAFAKDCLHAAIDVVTSGHAVAEGTVVAASPCRTSSDGTEDIANGQCNTNGSGPSTAGYQLTIAIPGTQVAGWSADKSGSTVTWGCKPTENMPEVEGLNLAMNSNAVCDGHGLWIPNYWSSEFQDDLANFVANVGDHFDLDQMPSASPVDASGRIAYVRGAVGLGDEGQPAANEDVDQASICGDAAEFLGCQLAYWAANPEPQSGDDDAFCAPPSPSAADDWQGSSGPAWETWSFLGRSWTGWQNCMMKRYAGNMTYSETYIQCCRVQYQTVIQYPIDEFKPIATGPSSWCTAQSPCPKPYNDDIISEAETAVREGFGIGQNGVENDWSKGGQRFKAGHPDDQQPWEFNSFAVQEASNQFPSTGEPSVFELQNVGPTTCEQGDGPACNHIPSSNDCAYDNTEIFEYLAQHYYPNAAKSPVSATEPRNGNSVYGPTHLEVYYQDLETAFSGKEDDAVDAKTVSSVYNLWITHNHTAIPDPLNPDGIVSAKNGGGCGAG
jgi:hypothetical protein